MSHAFYGGLEGASARLSTPTPGSDEQDETGNVDIDDDDHIAEFANSPGDCLSTLDEPAVAGTLVCVPWLYETDGESEQRYCIGRVVRYLKSFRNQTAAGPHYSVKFVADGSTYAAPCSTVFLVDDGDSER